MKVGWVGLGKLGFPCAMVLAQHHEVWGYDVSDRAWRIADGTDVPMQEEGLPELLRNGRHMGRAGSVAEVVKNADIVFVAVQTPHAPEYGGEQPMPEETRDFEYAYLVQACRDVARAALQQEKYVTLVVVSTVLPGTTDKLIRPLLNAYTDLVYSPQFIAMGTTLADFSNPEFVICGAYGKLSVDLLRSVFKPVHGNDRLFVTGYTTAESIKVLYNTFVSMKVVWANHVMELCEKTGADCDRVVDALSLATERVISPKYMRGGMGDGGACHPRDLIAMHWLEQRLGMAVPLFGGLAKAREQQTQWLAKLVTAYTGPGMRVVLLGKSYKPGSDLIAGSPALLLKHYLELEGQHPEVHDPHTGDGLPLALDRPAVFVTSTRHDDWRTLRFPRGSVVIDVFGYLEDQEGVTMLRVGRQ